MFEFLRRLFGYPETREERLDRLLQRKKELECLYSQYLWTKYDKSVCLKQQIEDVQSSINELATEIEMERRTRFIFECRRAGIKMSYLRAIDGDYLGGVKGNGQF